MEEKAFPTTDSAGARGAGARCGFSGEVMKLLRPLVAENQHLEFQAGSAVGFNYLSIVCSANLMPTTSFEPSSVRTIYCIA